MCDIQNSSSSEENNISLISWNVNGIRSICNKGFLPWLRKSNPDILCLQETRADRTKLDTCLLHLPDSTEKRSKCVR